MTKEMFGNILIDARQKGIEAIVGMSDTFPCGGAYHSVSGNSEIVKMFKKFGEKDQGGAYEFLGWTARKGYPTGYHIRHGGNNYQNMDMHSARATAESGFLGMNGLPTSVHTYID